MSGFPTGGPIGVGQKVESLSINRVSVADGYTARVMILGPRDRFAWPVHLAYDEQVRAYVNVSPEDVIKYQLSPSLYYFILVARLNTDQAGNIYGENFKVEYLRLSSNHYNKLNKGLSENPNFTCLSIEKEKKTVEGRDMSYLVPTASSMVLPAGLVQRVQDFIATPGAVENVWKMVFATSFISSEVYEQRLKAASALSAAAQNVPHISYQNQSAAPVGAYPGQSTQALPPPPPVGGVQPYGMPGSSTPTPGYNMPAPPAGGAVIPQAPFGAQPGFGDTPSVSPGPSFSAPSMTVPLNPTPTPTPAPVAAPVQAPAPAPPVEPMAPQYISSAPPVGSFSSGSPVPPPVQTFGNIPEAEIVGQGDMDMGGSAFDIPSDAF